MNANDPDGEFGVPGAIFGGVAGGIGGFIASKGSWMTKLSGTIAGAGTGAAVGALNPAASYGANTAIALALTGAGSIDVPLDL